MSRIEHSSHRVWRTAAVTLALVASLLVAAPASQVNAQFTPGLRFTDVATGEDFSCALDTAGDVWCWGNGADGRLGRGTMGGADPIPAPVVNLGQPAIDVETQGQSTCALLQDRTVRCWGENNVGQLGDGTTTDTATPVVVNGLADVEMLSVGSSSACAVIVGGQLVCWGRNNDGQIGDGTTTHAPAPTPVTGFSDAAAVSVGLNEACALRTDNTVWCWGGNRRGELGNGTTDDSSVPVAVIGLTFTPTGVVVGDSKACAYNTAALACWGTGGELGDGTTTNSAVPVDVVGPVGVTYMVSGEDNSCAIDGDGALWCWGGNDEGEVGNGTTSDDVLVPTLVTGASDTVAVDVGGDHLCLVGADGAARCWGDDDDGVLGEGSPLAIDQPTNIAVSATRVEAFGESTCVIEPTGLASCWGLNLAGQLGDGTVTDRGAPTRATVNGPVSSINVGNLHGCALSAGALECWGLNVTGAVGDGTNEPRLDPTPVTGLTGPVTSFDVGSQFTCAVDAGAGKCWGSVFSGVLGSGNRQEYSPVGIAGLESGVAAISAGQSHACALTSVGAAMCWGQNSLGQVGDGSRTARTTPTAVTGLSTGVASISGGRNHTCAAMDDGTARCWGFNGSGALGTASPVISAVPVVVSDLSDVEQISAGGRHTCARNSTTTWCWGHNEEGQLGDGSRESSSSPVEVTLPEPAVDIATGSAHSCAVLVSGQVWCWGDDEGGQLGVGSTSRSTIPHRAGFDPGVLTLGGLENVSESAGSVPISIERSPFADGELVVHIATADGTATAGADYTPVNTTVTWADGESGAKTIDVAILTDRIIEGDESFTVAVTDAAGAGLAADSVTVTISNVDLGVLALPEPIMVLETAGTVEVPIDWTPGIAGPQTIRVATANGTATAGTDYTPVNTTVTWAHGESGTKTIAVPVVADRAVEGNESFTLEVTQADGLTLATTTLEVTLIDVAAPRLTAIDPARLADTRAAGDTVDGRFAGDGRLEPNREYRVQVTGRGAVPFGASAALVNVTAIRPADAGYLTVHPCTAPPPTVSALNFTAGVTLGNEVLAPLSTSGEMCINANADIDVSIDASAYLIPPADDLPAPDVIAIVPTRLADSRVAGEAAAALSEGFDRTQAGSTTRIVLAGSNGIPADARAVVVNITSIKPANDGYATVHPCLADVPGASSLNVAAGTTRGNEIVAALDADGAVCIFTSAPMDLTIDAAGYVPASAPFEPIGPARLLDTRPAESTIDGEAAGAGSRASGSTTRLQIAGRAGVPVGTEAVVINITAIRPEAVGFITVDACGDERPLTSALNHANRVTGGNEIITRLNAAGEICIYSSAKTHISVDVTHRLA